MMVSVACMDVVGNQIEIVKIPADVWRAMMLAYRASGGRDRALTEWLYLPHTNALRQSPELPPRTAYISRLS